MGKRVDRTVIDHMSGGIASSTVSKVANFVSMSPSMTDITLGCQTMMGSVTGGCLLAGRAAVHGAEEPMVTEIHTNVTLGGGRAGARVLYEDSGGGGCDPLLFSDLNADGIVIVYWGGSR